MKHLHHTFRAYDELTEDEGIRFAIDIQVEGYEKEEDALEAVKKIAKRKNYWLTNVKECEQCGLYAESVANQRYLAAAMGKMTDHNHE